LSVPEVLEHPQIIERKLIQEFDSSILTSGRLRVTRSGFSTSSGLPSANCEPPKLGAHTRCILAEIGVEALELEQLADEGVI
jgi:CoA:oxalate CoA-transferase